MDEGGGVDEEGDEGVTEGAEAGWPPVESRDVGVAEVQISSITLAIRCNTK
jgi:hypothetical protein